LYLTIKFNEPVDCSSSGSESFFGRCRSRSYNQQRPKNLPIYLLSLQMLKKNQALNKRNSIKKYLNKTKQIIKLIRN